MIKNKEIFIVFLIGAFGYALIEIAWRGYTHWSMMVTGGICFAVFYKLVSMSKINLINKCLLSMIIITTFEFVVGCLVNLAWGLNVWDYSNEFLNFNGQICPLFSMFWFFMGIPMSIISTLIYGRENEISI